VRLSKADASAGGERSSEQVRMVDWFAALVWFAEEVGRETDSVHEQNTSASDDPANWL
jgi:hypothetical protein